MERRIIFLGLLFLTLASPALAAGDLSVFDTELSNVISRLDREASTKAEGPARLTVLIQREYRTTGDELEWALENELSWGAIAAVAYIQATIGRSFAEIADGARTGWGYYVENAGMNQEKMARSLEKFLKLAE